MFVHKYYFKIFPIKVSTIIFILLSFLSQNAKAGSKEGHNAIVETINFTVTVTDKSTSDPLQLVNVILKRGKTIIAAKATNPFGRAIFNEIQNGVYEISTRMIGYYD
ncbi:MAG: hypothetical protein P4L35_05300, partial [Ignavibacteriaceae bacterium]|nr:hypothetical protein [Ignavibacteriaceae bacterium]